MAMPGCERCNIKETSVYSECDLLGTYSYLCKQMPGMSQCKEYKSMCSSNPSIAGCSQVDEGGSLDPPIMKMFFHSGFADYVLFESWVPRNALQYWLTLFVCFVAASLYEALQVFISIRETKWILSGYSKTEVLDHAFGGLGNEKLSSSVSPMSHLCGLSMGIDGVRIASVRGIFRILSTTLGYGLMLLAMTFNVGIFLSIILGFGVGTFIFVPVLKLGYSNNAINDGNSNSSDCH
jgi:copper transporter 1